MGLCDHRRRLQASPLCATGFRFQWFTGNLISDRPRLFKEMIVLSHDPNGIISRWNIERGVLFVLYPPSIRGVEVQHAILFVDFNPIAHDLVSVARDFAFSEHPSSNMALNRRAFRDHASLD
jgi:hypothetical protein